jgi:hypothetical protein
MDPFRRCSWTKDRKGVSVTSCGHSTTEAVEELEICKFCGGLVEYVPADELEEITEAVDDKELPNWGSSMRPATPEWSAAMEELCTDH